MKIHPIIAALALLCASCRHSVLTEQRILWDVHCDLQVVSMPQELALPLMNNLRDSNRSEGAFKDIQKLLADKRATLVGWPAMTTRSGQRAVMEQIVEVRYATEYSHGVVTPPSGQPPNPNATPEQKPDVPGLEPIPTSFETRNTGVTFEFEPVVAGDGDLIEMNMVPQDVRQLGWTTATIEKDPPGVKLTVNQPLFVTNKLTTSMTFRNGERKLIGLFKLTEPAETLELFILRVDASKRRVTVDRPIAPPAPPRTSPALAPVPPASPGQ